MNTQISKTSSSAQTKLKKLVTTSCRPMKSFGKTKSLKPLKVIKTKIRTQVAK